MPTLRLDIDEAEFKKHLAAIIARGGVSLHQAVLTAFKTGITQHLDELVARGICLRYSFKNGSQSRVLSLKEAAANSGFDFWYLTIQIDFPSGTTISECDVRRPARIRWLPIDYGGGVRKSFQFKRSTMKTRERCEIQILHPQIPAKFFRSMLECFPKECPCSKKHLTPISAGVWEWRQAFGCVICGKKYYCDCFRAAMQRASEAEKQQIPDDATKQDLEELTRFIDKEYSAEYRSEVCHLCTGTPSNLLYCSPMYGSAVKVRYGAYMQKFAIAEGLSPRDAENRVRDILGLPRIGEGWVNETQLFRLLQVIFSNHLVIREARPEWLGNQRLDFFLPTLSLAVEYQGEQHFRPVERFGGKAALQNTQMRDARKRRLCKENGVRLIYFTHAEDLTVEQVERKLRKFMTEPKDSASKTRGI